MTGLSYTPALIVAVNSDRSEDKYLYAPFVGPWLDLAARDDGDKLDNTLLVVDGVFQTIGLLQLVASFMWVDDGDDAVGQCIQSFGSHPCPPDAALQAGSDIPDSPYGTATSNGAKSPANG